jgi:ribosomal protein S18 acetylase RimI-like enzyme
MDYDKTIPARLIVRELRIDDYDRVLALWTAGGLPHRPRGRDGRAEIQRQIQKPTAVYLVAEAEGEIVGVVLGTHDGRKGWVNRLAVLPDYRRRNVGATLVGEVERRLAAAGIRIFACFIEEGNDVSQAFFEGLGYERFGGVVYYMKRKNNDV